ncbi:MAG: ABC transporter substrate-binding protein [Ktedonobacterales bacterium]
MRLGKKSFAIGLTMVALFTMVLSACSIGGSSGVGALPDAKQILRYSIVPDSPDIRRLDPDLTVDVYSYSMEQLIFPQLYTWDSNLNTIPWGADGMPTISNGGLTYTIKIHSGMKWSDGTAIDANTYAYSLNRALDPCVHGGAPSSAGFFIYAIKGAVAYNSEKCTADPASLNPAATDTLIGKSIVVQDPQTLVITLEAPYGYFLKTLTTSVSMAVPKQLIQQYGWKNWTDHLADTTFSGNMFGVKLWDHKGNLTLVRNDNFAGFGIAAKPKLKEIDVKIYQTADAEWADYQTNRLDVGGPPSSDYQAAKSRPDFHEGPVLSMGYLLPNWNKAPFNNVLARQAFALAINKTLLANQVEKGTVYASDHMIPQGNPGYNANLQGVDGAPLTGDPAKAKAAITQYAAAACGGDITKCTPVDFYNTNDPTSQLVTSALVAQWNAALPGYKITPHSVSFDDLINELYGPPSGVAQLTAIGYAVDYPDPQDWTSLQALPTSGTNTTGINLKAANDLMNAADVNQDQTSRFKQYQDAEQLLVQNVAWITLDQSKQFWTQNKKLQNFSLTSNLFPTFQSWDTAYLKS